jgi:hypothetical protein
MTEVSQAIGPGERLAGSARQAGLFSARPPVVASPGQEARPYEPASASLQSPDHGAPLSSRATSSPGKPVHSSGVRPCWMANFTRLGTSSIPSLRIRRLR